ncbi:hypothetical protein KUTeg_010857 [Tegillarca granosa]|uniref:dUTP diphosphatase n=1 Tax=Tegillarca granosa TaxID=220873 RepID=A0ABQ9F6J8_TEGGR|nr:hypothetical protein KUTeg_010857 [Tegillarca granosa]
MSTIAEQLVGKENITSSPAKRQRTMLLDSVVLRFAKLTEKALTPTRAPRSGLAAKHFIDIGEGDRIAQLICEKIYMPELKEHAKLDDTDRGEGGFGSTGRN